MNTSLKVQSPRRSQFFWGLLLGLLISPGFAASSFAAQSFVVPLPEATVADASADFLGTTYIVTTMGSGTSVVRKYGPSGAPSAWDGKDLYDRTNSPLTATAMCVAPGGTNLFIVGPDRIVRLSADTGLELAGLSVPSTISPMGVSSDGTNVFVSGTYNSSVSNLVFQLPAQPRGSRAGILVKLNFSLSSTGLALTTFGGSAGGSSAESVAVDESGAVYVSGQMASGSFNYDGNIDANGLWRVDVVYSSAGIGDLGTALNVLNGANATSTNTAYFNKINFGSGSDGGFGGDAPFPGGGGNHFVLHATGSIWISSAGNYDFFSTTDDGTQLKIDNGSPLFTAGLRGVATSSATVNLTKGLHTVDYVMFQNEGAASAELLYRNTGNPYVYWLQPTTLRDTQNKGYVAKFNGNFSSLQNAYFTASETPGSGGAFHELRYSKGWVYAVGFWKGLAVNPAIGQPDNSVDGSSDIDVVRLDTNLKLKGRATVKGHADNDARSISSDEKGNVYITGTYGPGSVDFVGNGDRSPADASQDRKFASLSSSQTSLFVAKLSSSMDFEWVNQPSDPVPGSFGDVARVRWNPILQRLFWVGSFANGVLTLGQPNSLKSMNGPESFFAVLDPDGSFTEQVWLTIISDFGGGNVLPFGGPLNGGNPDKNNRRPVIKGALINASVPANIFLAGGVDTNITAEAADTRISSTGYSVGNNVVNGTANSYSFTITEDTVVTFHWQVNYALVIDSDLTGTKGNGIPGSVPGLPQLQSLAAGNPDPSVQKHWYPEHELVAPQIDPEVLDFSAPGLPIKYQVTGYTASGYANQNNHTQTGTFPLTGNQRQQIPQFKMDGPATIVYQWKLKIGVQVSTTGPKSSGLPLVHVVRDPGQTAATPSQLDGVGVGTFYYDEGTTLQVVTIKHQGLIQLNGWFNGDGPINGSAAGTFADSGKLADLPSFTINSQAYVGIQASNLVRPARVMWDYGDRIFEETVTIGNSVTFKTVDDPVVKAALRMDIPPDRIEVSDGPSGSVGDNMAIWDAVGKKYYPLRPGIVLSYWLTTSDPADRVIIRLTFQYPTEPHYHHIAQTPPVALDPGTNDLVSFDSLKYTEPTTGAAVDSSGKFTATGRGKTVLLFNEISSDGRGGISKTLRVREVQTSAWNDDIHTEPAVIGQKITSALDYARLDSGYTFFTGARYNPSIYKRDQLQGPIIPVNMFPSAGSTDQLVVVWYEIRDKILWPHKAVNYTPEWPTVANGLNRIVIASRFGNESVAPDGTDQIVAPAEVIGTNNYPAETAFNPVRFQQLKVYNQPDPAGIGYNPNEEHAVLAPSLRSAAVSPQPMAVYALRNGDLNVTNQDATYTSDPYVLVQFFDAVDQEFKMKVYSIERTASNLNVGDLSYNYTFEQEMLAGEPVIPFYPLVSVIGATPCSSTYGRDGQPSDQRCFWKDHKGTGWAVSGDSFFFMYFYYPLSPDFWWPPQDNKQAGDCVAWLPDAPGFAGTSFLNSSGTTIDYRRNNQHPTAQSVLYTTTWPQDVAILKAGETLTFPGGEYHQDNPKTVVTTDTGDIEIKDTPGLPGVVGFAAGQIVFDTLNPIMDDQLAFDHNTAVIYPALEQRTVTLAITDFPDLLLPANNRTKVNGGNYVFVELPSSLQKRIFYNPITGKLGIQGFLNDKAIGDATLTASPPAVYVLEPNVITATEKGILDGTGAGSPFTDLRGSKFAQAMDALYDLSRNPNALHQNGSALPDQAYRVGVEQKIQQDPATGLALTTTNFGIVSPLRDPTKAAPLQALGPGLAMVANPAFLRPNNTVEISYVTLAENNSDSLGGAPVVLHIIKVDKHQRYRGAIKTILSANVFDENIILRHTGDFGGNADELVFEWWYRPEDGTDALPPDRQPSPNPWKLFADPSGQQGRGYYQLILKGNPSAPEALIGDSLFYLRYRHKDELTQGVNWEVPQTNQTDFASTGGEQHCVLNDCRPGIPYQWAGAGNSSPQDLNGDGLPDFQPQLAEGWIKRVLDRVNVYEARINDFSVDNPATYSSMIRELGARYEGPVALNPDKNVIENVGLIPLYQTILNRGRSLSIDLSTPVATPSIANALELASTRLGDFYTLLGNEAYADALNPTIGFGSDSVDYGKLAPTIFCFQNQVSSLLEEELALLRGQDAYKGPPVYNRLFWNFTHAEGEAAYAMNYDIVDANKDGFIDVNDAMILYPQGHGDAWGHFLTATKMQYDLLRHPFFNWVSRSEFLNLQDIVIPVDYLDERKFAQFAAAKAKVGAEIVNMTYREKYVGDPAGQWQGYTDTDKNRAWGVEEWARRAGQGAYFDWVTANALLPAVHPNTNYTGIQKVDRTTVQDIAVVGANLVAVQTTMDQVNNGNNPLGLAQGALTFDLDPTFLEVGSTAQIGTRAVQGLLHFDQIFERALQALKNALTAFDNANQINNMIRQIANSENEFQNSVFEEDLSYRNQLIEIFGTPYEGTIGSGKAYPAGYQGPDTTLYMYVAVNTLNDNTAPKAPAAYISSYAAEVQGGANEHFISGTGIIPGFDNSWVQRYGLSFQFPSNIVNSLNYSDFTDPNVNSFVDPSMQTNLNLPIMAKGFSYVAPPDWGKRSSPGELQQIITQMLQSQADLNNSIYDWYAASSQYVLDLQTINAKYDNNKTIQDLMKGQIAADSISGGIGIVLGVLKRTFDSIDQTVNESAEAFAEMDPRNLPTVGLADSPGDILAPVRGAVEELGVSVGAALKGAALSWDTAIDANNLAKDIADAVIALQQDSAERNFDMIQSLLALNFNSSNESATRINVFKQVQALTELSDQYRAKLAEGKRLIEQRTAFNKRVAAQTQMNRYQDMTFRVSRNAALEKYRSSFDLAARYAYLTATAYDYDVNLATTDAGSPVGIFSDIIKQRTLGVLNDDGQPAVGYGGLSEDLAILRANFDTLKARMGLNNYLREQGTTFSLRSEALRMDPGTNGDIPWQQMLSSPQVYKPDLWQVPEFRRYCRPFSSFTNGPQPGLVIPFSTQITSGKNFFGWPLGGGDNAYDPSIYATKIDSVGVWFANYDVASLPVTPRVYWIPVGQDIMTIPNDPDLNVRVWNVLDQVIPVPFPGISSRLNDPTWKPLTDSLDGPMGQTKKFSSLLAFGFDHDQLSSDESAGLVFNARLVGRSAWNTRWLLIIPGATLNVDPNTGLNLFINSVKDIKLVINSYGFSGN